MINQDPPAWSKNSSGQAFLHFRSKKGDIENIKQIGEKWLDHTLGNDGEEQEEDDQESIINMKTQRWRAGEIT